MSTYASIGVGSNLDSPIVHVTSALAEIGRIPATRLVARSSLYRSAPVQCGPGDPDYVNAAVIVSTRLAPGRLLSELQAIERRHARKRGARNAARTLDLDLLLYGHERRRTLRLTLPHPRLVRRAFVLRPLLEIDRAARIAGRGPAMRYLAATRSQRIECLGAPRGLASAPPPDAA